MTDSMLPLTRILWWLSSSQIVMSNQVTFDDFIVYVFGKFVNLFLCVLDEIEVDEDLLFIILQPNRDHWISFLKVFIGFAVTMYWYMSRF